MDQPSQCLRDEIDDIDFELVENQDLSSMVPPTLVSLDGRQADFMFVDSADKMKACIQQLQQEVPTEIAFDLEAYNVSKYTQITCLLQLATKTSEYVIDPLSPGVWNEIPALGDLFADPKIVKVGHSIGSLDVRCLHRDFGIIVVNAFDTYEAAKVLRLPSLGLAQVCIHYGLRDSERYIKLKDKYQTTDWRVRPLTERMVQYGRYDVHFLLKLRELMIRDLTRDELWDSAIDPDEFREVSERLADTLRKMNQIAADNDGDLDLAMEELNVDALETSIEEKKSRFEAKDLRLQLDLMKVLSCSQERCRSWWSNKDEPPLKNTVFLALQKRADRGKLDSWTPAHKELYLELARWRDLVAEKEACLPGFVSSLDFLVHVALRCPTREAGLRRITLFLPQLLEQQIDYRTELLDVVKSSGIAKEEETYCYADIAEKQRRAQEDLKWTATAVAVCAAIALTAFAIGNKRR